MLGGGRTPISDISLDEIGLLQTPTIRHQLEGGGDGWKHLTHQFPQLEHTYCKLGATSSIEFLGCMAFIFRATSPMRLRARDQYT
jgi:hypothetical protein